MTSPGTAGTVPEPTLSRRTARLLVGVAIWNILTYAMFTKNLYFHGTDEPHRPTGYYVAHTVLIIVNILIALVLAPIGWRALQAYRARAVAPPVQSGSQNPSVGV